MNAILIFITSFLLNNHTGKKDVCPSINFEIKYNSILPNDDYYFYVNGIKHTINSPSKLWQGYVEVDHGCGMYFFEPNKIYSIRYKLAGPNINNKSTLCVKFDSDFLENGTAPSIEFNPVTNKFNIIHLGSKCQIFLSKYNCIKSKNSVEASNPNKDK